MLLCCIYITCLCVISYSLTNLNTEYSLSRLCVTVLLVVSISAWQWPCVWSEELRDSMLPDRAHWYDPHYCRIFYRCLVQTLRELWQLATHCPPVSTKLMKLLRGKYITKKLRNLPIAGTAFPDDKYNMSNNSPVLPAAQCNFTQYTVHVLYVDQLETIA